MSVKIEFIEYFSFSIGGYFDGYSELIYEDGAFSKNRYPEHIFELEELKYFDEETFGSIKTLINTLNKIHLIKWPRRFEEPVCDGTQWGLEIRYNCHRTTKKVYGSNAYPAVIEENGKIKIISASDYTPEFKKLLTTLNRIVKRPKYFY